MLRRGEIDSSESDNKKMYYQYLPEHLRQRYLDGVGDKELLHLNHQIALLDVRITQLLESMDEDLVTYDKVRQMVEEPFAQAPDDIKDRIAQFTFDNIPMQRINEPTFETLQNLVREYRKTDNATRKQSKLDELFMIIERGQNQGEQWKEINEIMENRRKLVIAEQQRQERAQGSVTLERVVQILGFTIEALREAVHKHVYELETRDLILANASEIYQRRLGVEFDTEPDAERVERGREAN